MSAAVLFHNASICHCSAALTPVFTVYSLCDSSAEKRYPPATAYATVNIVKPRVDNRKPATRLHNSAHCRFRCDMRTCCTGDLVCDVNDDDDDDADGVFLAETMSTSAGSSCPSSCDDVSARSSQTTIIGRVAALRLYFRYAGNNRKLIDVSLSASSMMVSRDVLVIQRVSDDSNWSTSSRSVEIYHVGH